MSTHKHIDKICCVILVATLALTAVFLNGTKFLVKADTVSMGYISKLFDTSTVHSINIIMDDWDGFLDTCTNEEYVVCTVSIDNNTYKNVAIRAKGNTSLTQVKSYGNDRYSFKIEFDHYDNSQTYFGLDKLCLNNVIQDNTYMKDYLVYQMMGAFGVAAPLCSYAYITVNGEDWGLYLAVEGMDESFLQRNYGRDYGSLYKPDSQGMGGGRGNGRKFNMEDFADFFDGKFDSGDIADDLGGNFVPGNIPGGFGGDFNPGNIPDGFGGDFNPDNIPGGFGGDFGSGNIPDGFGDFGSGNIPGGFGDNLGSGNTPGGFGGNLGSGNRPDVSDRNFGPGNQGQQLPNNIPQNVMPQGGMPQDGMLQDGMLQGGILQDGMPQSSILQDGMPQGGMQGGALGGMEGMAMGSNDVLLIYTDDEYESYSNIFDTAKTTITSNDKDRLIASLKSLNANENIENIVDIDSVIRYFVVHNFVLNFDSYTGSMIHNYYLHEKNGMLSMLPWDYNLAFGGFNQGADATSLVNYPIDSPVSGGTIDSRPMLAWIFEDETYTKLYHQYFNEFISEYFDNGYFSEMIDTVTNMIAPYVEKDPTKFCTYEEFECGAATLKEFSLLRAKSVRGQLDGTIASTSEAQKLNSDEFIDADGLTISDMGSMNNFMGPGGKFDFGNDRETLPDMPDMAGRPSGSEFNFGNGGKNNGNNDGKDISGIPGMPDIPNMAGRSSGSESSTWILLGVSVCVLFSGLLFAGFYKRRRK